jgi:hypothetical protein
MEDHAVSQPERKPLLCREGHGGLCLLVRRLRLAAKLMQTGREDQG